MKARSCLLPFFQSDFPRYPNGRGALKSRDPAASNQRRIEDNGGRAAAAAA